jgi:hypothetical protein
MNTLLFMISVIMPFARISAYEFANFGHFLSPVSSMHNLYEVNHLVWYPDLT